MIVRYKKIKLFIPLGSEIAKRIQSLQSSAGIEYVLEEEFKKGTKMIGIL